MKNSEKVKKALFLICIVVCLIGSVVLLIQGIKSSITKMEFNSNSEITSAQVKRVGLTRYYYVFKVPPDTTTEYFSPRDQYVDYMADSITVKIVYDKTNPKINKPIGFHKFNYNPIIDITIVAIIAILPLILVGLYFLVYRKRKAIVVKGLIILFALMFVGVYIATLITPFIKGVDSIGFFSFLGGASAIILLLVGLIGSKKKP